MTKEDFEEIKELQHAVKCIGEREWTEREKHLDSKWSPFCVTSYLINHAETVTKERDELAAEVDRLKRANQFMQYALKDWSNETRPGGFDRGESALRKVRAILIGEDSK